MKYYYNMLIIFTILLIYHAYVKGDDDDKEEEEVSIPPKDAKLLSCFRVNYKKCVQKFADKLEELQKLEEHKKITSEEVRDRLKPTQEETYACMNGTEAIPKKCVFGYDSCVIAKMTFTDNTTLVSQDCDIGSGTRCLTYIDRENYEYYTGRKANFISCEFCTGDLCNIIEEDNTTDPYFWYFRKILPKTLIKG